MSAEQSAENDRITPADLALALRVLAPGDDDNVTLGDLRRGHIIPGNDALSFCEPVSATTRSREHIRIVGPEGFKYGGGIPNKALCGWNVERGWDLRAPVHPSRFLPNAEVNPTCQGCIDAYWDLVTPAAKRADYLLDGSPESVAVVREARGLPPIESQEEGS